MRHTQTVSVWPVGLVGGLMVERPKVENEKVVGWDVTWSPNRPYAIDMAGFAVNVKLFLSKNKAKFAYQVKRGHQESEFLKTLVTGLDELEPKAELCTKGRKNLECYFPNTWYCRTITPSSTQDIP